VITPADLLQTGAKLHAAYLAEGHLDHVGTFEACPAWRCVTLRREVHWVNNGRCENCGARIPADFGGVDLRCRR
jgi:hypothetical protein